MNKLSNRALSTAVLLAGIASPYAANATNGILPFGNGMTAHGLGGAGVANAADAMSAVDNPALLGQVADQMSLGISLFSPLRSADLGGGAGYVESDNNYFLIPQFGYTAEIDNKVNWGVLLTALGGMNTNYPAELFGIETEMDLSGLIISPTLSYKSGDDTYIGASLLLGWETLNTTLPNNLGQSITNEDSATGYGLKMGITSLDSEGNQYGAFYQTRIDMGEMEEHCSGDGLLATFTGDCSLNLPPMFGVGVSLKASSTSKIVMDFITVKWTDVEVFKDAFFWKDQNILKIGYENKVNSGYTWRIGYNHADSPVQDEFVVLSPAGPAPGVIAPAVTEDHYAFGFTKKIGKNELVGYYAYVPENELTDTTGLGGGTTKVKMSQHALGIGYNWK